MERLKLNEEKFSNDETLNRQVFLAALRDIFPALAVQSDDRIQKRIGKEKLEDMAEDVAGLIAVGTNFATNVQKNERIALTTKMLRCLERYVLHQIKVPFTINTLSNHVGLLEYAVDLNFPGYIRSGLIRYTVMSPRIIAA